MPLVSIVLPTRSRPAVLPRAIASVLGQTERDLELVIVDNTPPGAAPLSIEALGLAADLRVRLVRAPEANNAGSARNAGLATIRGDWVTFLDDDDAYHPEKIARQLALARETGSPLVLCSARFHLRNRARVPRMPDPFIAGDDLLVCTGLGTPLLFHRACDVRFDASFFAGEDHAYAHALISKFGLTRVPLLREPLVEVYQSASASDRTNLRAEAGWRASRRIWWQFGGFYSRRGRRLYVIRARIARAKLRGETRPILALVPALVRFGGLRQLRYATNAILVSQGWGPGRWLT